jgi:hypothetical protein
MFTDLARSNAALKQLLDEIMHEPDPAKYDLLGSEIWSVLAERERLDLTMTSLKVMESTLLGMKELRPYLGDGSSREMIDTLIQEAELQITGIKRHVIN